MDGHDRPIPARATPERSHPVRTCVGCRGRAAKSDLVRLVADGGVALVDSLQRRPGRGAYLHPSVDCLAQAGKRRPWGRALRTGVDAGAAEQMLREQFAALVPTAF